MKNLLLLIVILIAYSGYGQQKKNGLTITGSVDYAIADSGKIYLKKMDFLGKEEKLLLDSSAIDSSGKFMVKIPVADETTIYTLSFLYGRMYIILKDTAEMDITLTQDYTRPITTNSAATSTLYQLFLQHIENGNALDSLMYALEDEGKTFLQNGEYINKAIAFKASFKDNIFTELNNTTHPGLAIYLAYHLFDELNDDDMKQINDTGSADIKMADINDLKKAAKILANRFPKNKEVQLFVKKYNSEIEHLLL